MPTADFPRDPMAFMRRNILEIGPGCNPWQPEAHGDKVLRFRIVPAGHRAVFPTGGLVYQLLPARVNDHPVIRAYFCPYTAEATCYTVLGTAASFMFTEMMDGCTFGIGSDGGDGTVRIGHANYSIIGQKWDKVNQGPQRQASAQREVLKYNLGLDSTLIHPESYIDFNRPYHQVATVFGILGDFRNWSFYAQKYIDNMVPCLLKSVDQYHHF